MLLTISYEGTHYHGWQRQSNADTVQQRLESALSKLVKHSVTVSGASRTDGGVHAKGQRALFKTGCPIPADRVPVVLNSMLPDDIIITACTEVDGSFHPRFDAKMKLYTYHIWNDAIPDILWQKFSWRVPQMLDITAMQQALKTLIGTHDFLSFCAAGNSTTTTVRTIYSAEVAKEEQLMKIHLTGNGFLYKMVRIIVGTLVDMGKGRLNPAKMEAILQANNRSHAGKTAPAQGLVLQRIWYD